MFFRFWRLPWFHWQSVLVIDPRTSGIRRTAVPALGVRSPALVVPQAKGAAVEQQVRQAVLDPAVPRPLAATLAQAVAPQAQEDRVREECPGKAERPEQVRQARRDPGEP